ncbi:MAG: ribosome small subunit-dependent GTPase A [Gemmatimonadota bacterium]
MSDVVAVVLEREGGSYRVLVDGIERVAILRGKAKRAEERAVAGDRVRLDPATLGDDVVAIDAVEPRTSIMERRVPDGRGTRPVAANVDQVLVVTAARDPDPILQLIDRLLVVAEANDLPASVIVNKIDLGSPAGIIEHLALAGYPVIATTAKAGEGLELLRAALVGKVSVLTGPSGAGKSSLLNALEPGLGLRVGEISKKVRRGTHTTVSAVMIPLVQGGFVVDTPGFSEVGIWALHRDQVDQCLPEFLAVLGDCRFGDCTHRTEPGCAVRALVDAGGVPAERYASYLAIRAELEAIPEDWE